METKQRTIAIKSYKLVELAEIYEVSCYFMRRRLLKCKKAIGKREGHFYNADQVEQIFKLVRLPSNINIV
jgi:hypothetical protein